MLAQHLRIAADRRRRAQVQPHRPAGQPEPIVTGAAGRRRADARAASSARSTWPAGSATSGATRSARPRRPDGSRREVRAHVGWTCRADATTPRICRRSTTTSGSGPRRSARSTANRFHYNWHWFWDTGNGDLGNQGIHEVDIARWGLGVTHPTKVSAIGGKFMFDDDQETPNTLSAQLRVRRRRQEEDDDLRGAALDVAPRSRHQRREARQHDRQPVLRLEGLPGHRQLQQVLHVPGQGPEARADRDARATNTAPTSSTPCAAASGRT